MNSTRKTAIIVGALFIIATVSTLVSSVFFGSIHDPNYLTAVSANENQVLIAVLIMLVAIASIVSIPIMLYPILKKQSQSLALGYVGARIFEGFFFAGTIITLLSILSLSREFVSATTPVVSYFETSGSLLLSELNWSSILLDFPFVLSALILNYVLYKSKLIPRWLSGWGFIGAVIYVPGILLGMFSLTDPTILFAPLGLQEMALAAWLIGKGFNSSAITP
ncbi:MAG TPA: DUF4386 domain-containing protein [Candidatus Binatia bacterium]|nr:DUF4386 domain-containing protein [Candidatus Binatia bacterium]